MGVTGGVNGSKQTLFFPIKTNLLINFICLHFLWSNNTNNFKSIQYEIRIYQSSMCSATGQGG